MRIFENKDCMKGMSEYPDKYFDLAIVDPPYGIDINKSGRLVKEKGWEYKDWDKHIPDSNYFRELIRVSKNQIIWGGNYFFDNLGATKCFLIWDKKQPEEISFASCELAWTSFNTVAKTFYHHPQKDNKDRIHPTQKPLTLYKWLLKNYGNTGDKILDTHVGSASSLIACEELGFNYVGFELDPEYYQKASTRIDIYRSQLQFKF